MNYAWAAIAAHSSICGSRLNRSTNSERLRLWLSANAPSFSAAVGVNASKTCFFFSPCTALAAFGRLAILRWCVSFLQSSILYIYTYIYNIYIYITRENGVQWKTTNPLAATRGFVKGLNHLGCGALGGALNHPNRHINANQASARVISTKFTARVNGNGLSMTHLLAGLQCPSDCFIHPSSIRAIGFSQFFQFNSGAIASRGAK